MTFTPVNNMDVKKLLAMDMAELQVIQEYGMEAVTHPTHRY